MTGSDTSSVPARETLKERSTYGLYAGAERLARALPERGARILGAAIAAIAYWALPNMRATVTANQAQVLGLQIDDPLVRISTREAFRLYVRYWFDTFRLRDMTREQVLDRMDATGLEHIQAAIAGGKGAIAVLAHLGNWDAAGAWVFAEGVPVVSVAEELRPSRLYELFVRHREALGMRIVPLSKDGKAGRELAGLLEENYLVALVADRNLNARGVKVEMFGRARSLPAGPALLSITTGAPVLVCSVYTTKDGWRIVVEPPIAFERSGTLRNDVAALTGRIASRFEAAIMANPADWHLFQPAWEP
ncbi:MAG: phosphatidylinositol mannoside acyltransferase [Actinomycetota bacterium]